MSVIPAARELYGLQDTHVVPVEPAFCLGDTRLHPMTIEAFTRLRDDAKGAGFDLRIVSGFRSFERQLGIWNAKARGELPVFDGDERILDLAALSARQRVFAILKWSALPGASRHHWGSDADVVDAAGLAPEYRVRLSVEETRGNGPFAALHRWLDERIESGRSHGFFRPFDGLASKVAVEPWHLSFAPLAVECQSTFDASGLKQLLVGAGLDLQSCVDECCDEILHDYFWIPSCMYPLPWRARLSVAGAPA